ncbi:MAG: peptidylprolyl isomerase [Anaerolineaceae bacterium]|nr:peptidylprolyl isomerase [Anaerolineaceae bacterium]
MAKESTSKIVSKKHLARLDRENRQQRILQIGAAIVIVLVIGIISFGILDQTVLLNNKAVARVENDKITVAEFEKQVKFARWQMIKQYESTLQIYQMLGADPNYGASFLNNLRQIQSQLSPENAATQASTVLEQLITNRIIKHEAEKRGFTVSEAEVQEALHTAFNYFPNGEPTPTAVPSLMATSTLSPLQLTLAPPTATPTALPTPEASEPPAETPANTPTTDPALPTATPFPTSTPYTESGFQQAVEDYLAQLKDIGFTESDLRQLVYNNLLHNKVYDAITADISREEEQVWARHILLKDEPTAQALLKRIKNGEDWNKLAAEFSQDTSNKDKGGDLGWFGKGKMVPEFEEAAFKLDIGQISDPVQTQFGYHIIQVLGHEVRPLTDTEYTTLRQQAFDEWVQAQKETQKIEKYDLWMRVVPVEPTLPPDMVL